MGNLAIRKSAIVVPRTQNPCLTLQEIGNRAGCSREYVRQVLVGAGQPTKHYKVKASYICQLCAGVWIGLGLALWTPGPLGNFFLDGLLYKAVGHLVLEVQSLLRFSTELIKSHKRSTRRTKLR